MMCGQTSVAITSSGCAGLKRTSGVFAQQSAYKQAEVKKCNAQIPTSSNTNHANTKHKWEHSGNDVRTGNDVDATD